METSAHHLKYSLKLASITIMNSCIKSLLKKVHGIRRLQCSSSVLAYGFRKYHRGNDKAGYQGCAAYRRHAIETARIAFAQSLICPWFHLPYHRLVDGVNIGCIHSEITVVDGCINISLRLYITPFPKVSALIIISKLQSLKFACRSAAGSSSCRWFHLPDKLFASTVGFPQSIISLPMTFSISK